MTLPSTPFLPIPALGGYVPSAQELAELESIELVAEDNENLESDWHRHCMNLLIASVLYWFRDRTDFYVGGNMFIYFDPQHARNRNFRGPDFFVVNGGVELARKRDYWAVWRENNRYPDAIIELMSPTTELEDRTRKFQIYEQTFRTGNYFLYDPETHTLEGWELNGQGRYDSLRPNAAGRLWCSALGLWLGTWRGEYMRATRTWLRFYDADESLVLIPEEAAQQNATAEHRRAEAERQRAEAAEAELARLKALLQQQTKNGGPAA